MSETKEQVYQLSDGLGKAYYSVIAADGSYGTVKELGDLIEMSIQPSESNVALWAGNREITNVNGTRKANLTLTLPAISKDVKCDIYNYVKTAEGGMTRGKKKSNPYIAIMIEQTTFNSETGEEAIDYITLLKGKMEGSEIKGKTKDKDNREIQTSSISGEFTCPEGLDDYIYIVSSDDEKFNAETWATKWGKTVPVPEIPEEDIP